MLGTTQTHFHGVYLLKLMFRFLRGFRIGIKKTKINQISSKEKNLNQTFSLLLNHKHNMN